MTSMQARHPRFMIACAARTGSTMLVRTLRSHPRLIVHGEVFGDGMVGVDGPLGRDCEADRTVRDALEAMRFAEPARALETFLERHDAEAVGFKLKYDELVRPQWQEIRRMVEADTDLAGGAAEDQARVALFLASDQSAFVTGHNIPVDGGTKAGGGWFWSPTASRFVNRPRTL